MSEISRWSHAADVRAALVMYTQDSRWANVDFWAEFLKERRVFFSQKDISSDPKQTERVKLKGDFTEWINGSREQWWSRGNWASQDYFVDWHVAHYLKQSKDSERRGKGKPRSGDRPQPSRVYDPVRDYT